jgi:hypothetical protein
MPTDIEEQLTETSVPFRSVSVKYAVTGVIFFLSVIFCVFYSDYEVTEKYSLPLSPIEGFGKNLILVKVHKVGGSTVAGVVRRIGDHYNLSGVYIYDQWIRHEPGIWAAHMNYMEMKPRLDRLTRPYHLIAWIRDPMSRCLSNFYHKERMYFHQHHRISAPINEERILSYLKDCRNNQYHYLRKKSGQSVNETVAMYDLIGLTEEFDKGLLVLKHQLHLKTRDILWIKPSKDSQDTEVHDVPFQNQTDTIKAFLPKFKAFNRLDYELYSLAKVRLNAMARAIPSFDQELIEYEKIRHNAVQHCSLIPDAYMHCYFGDNGCGYVCMDEFLP